METEEPEQPRPVGFSIFFPVLFGVVRAPPLPEGTAGPAEPDRLVIIDPLSQRMVVFQDDAAADPFEAALRAVLAMSEAAEEGRRGPPPASKASILAMRAVDAAEVGEGECAVCLEALRGEDGGDRSPEEEEEEEKGEVVVKEMPCGHRYHGGCIGKWLGLHGSCPVCRYRMPEEEEATAKKPESGGAGEVWVRIESRDDGSQQQQESQQEHHQQQQQEDQSSVEQRDPRGDEIED